MPTLKLALRLYVTFMETAVADDRLPFVKNFLVGALASDLDDPSHRMDARVAAEVAGLPADFIDGLPARVRSVSGAEVKTAIARHVHARDLAITAVGTASNLRPRLIDAKVQPSATDVVPYDSY